MLDYTDFLATRGWRRVLVERTLKAPGDLVLGSKECVRVPEVSRVTPIRKRGVA